MKFPRVLVRSRRGAPSARSGPGNSQPGGSVRGFDVNWPMLPATSPTALGRKRVAVRLVSGALLLVLASRAEAADQPGAERVREPPAPETDAALEGDPLYREYLGINYVFNRELYELCVPRYEKLLASKPGPALAAHVHYALGLCHYQLAARLLRGSESSLLSSAGPARAQGAAPKGKAAEHLRKSLEHLKTAIRERKFGARLSATVALGQTLLLSGDYAAASQAFGWALEQSPSREDLESALWGLADAKYRSGDFDGAARAYRQLAGRVESADGRERAAFDLAVAIYRKLEGAANFGAEPEAAECEKIFSEIAARSDSPLRGDAAYMLALTSERRGDEEGALKRFAELAASDEGERAELALFGLAAALARGGRHGEACDAWARFLKRHPSSPYRDLASLHFARSLLETGRRGQALSTLEGLLRSPTAGVDAALLFARSEVARRGDLKRAAEVLESALSARPEDPRRAELELELASVRIESGALREAVEALRSLARIPGCKERATYLLALALQRSGDWEGSLRACAELKDMRPDSPFFEGVLAIEAENRFLAGDYLKAHEAYEAYLARLGARGDPEKLRRARYRSAEALYFAGAYEKAREALASLARASASGEPGEGSAEIHLLLGDCSYQLKDYETAAAEFRRFLEEAEASGSKARPPSGARPEVRPEDAAEARFKLAHSLELAGKTKEAEEAYGAALASDPGGPRANEIRFQLGHLAFARKDYAAAAARFEEVLRSGLSAKVVPDALRFLAWIRRERGDPCGAAEAYEKFVESFPEHPSAPDAELELAASLEACGRREDAEKRLRDFESRHPGDPRLSVASLRQAQILAKAGRHSEALTVLEGLRDSPAAEKILGSVLYEVAWCFRELGRLEDARKAYRDLLERGSPPELRAAATVELAELEFERKAYAEARDLLAPLCRDSPDEKALYRLAWCHHELGEPAEVIARAKAFGEAFPESDF